VIQEFTVQLPDTKQKSAEVQMPQGRAFSQKEDQNGKKLQ